MRDRLLNALSMLFGFVLLLTSLDSIFHHEYMYFDLFRHIWVSTVFELVAGVWFYVYGLIGLIRKGKCLPAIDFSTWREGAVALTVLSVSAIIAAHFLHSTIWLIIVPIGVITLVFFIAAIQPMRPRIVTADEFANELERHLLGKPGNYDWTDTTSVPIDDDHLERIRWKLRKFDSLADERDKEELKEIIVALRRGELPEINPPEYLTYDSR